MSTTTVDRLATRYYSAKAALENATTHRQERLAQDRIAKIIDTADAAGVTDELLARIGY